MIPVVLGPCLGLDQSGFAEYAQRMFLYIGIGSLIQIYFGHRLPVIEGPAAQWWVIIISISGVAAKKPFVIFCLMMIGVSFFPQVGALLASIPQAVGYAVLLAAFTQLLKIIYSCINRNAIINFG